MDTNEPCITQDRRPPAMDDLSGFVEYPEIDHIE